MAATRRQSVQRRVSGKPIAGRRPRKTAGRLMSRAEMVAAVSKYTADAIAAMMKIVRSNAPHLASVRTQAVSALRKHGWAKILPRKQATARKRPKPPARKPRGL